MGQTLTHGVYLPDEGERNCYNGLAANWQILDGSVGTIAAHAAALAGKAPAVHTHTKSDITDFPAYGTTAGTICEGNDSRLSDARTPVAHTHTKSDVTDLFNSSNTWTANNTYTGMMILNSSSDVVEQFRQKLPKDVSTSSDALVRFNTLVDSAGHNVVVNSEGHWDTYVAKSISLKYKNDSTKQGSIEIRLRSDGSGILYAQSPFECDLGNSSNQWNNLYAKNYYYNGTAWGLDKANVWSQSQTISYTGSNVQFALKHTETDISSSPTRNNWFYLSFYDVNSISVGGYNYSKRTNGNARLYLNLRTKNTNNDIVEKNIYFETNQEGTVWNLYPSSDAYINLGTSSARWKTLNGINPGALSLPDIANYIDLTSNIPAASLDGTTNIDLSSYITSNGWLAITVPDTNTDDFVFVQVIGTLANRYFASGARGLNFISLMMPINRGGDVLAKIKASSVTFCRFYHCLGHVA